MNKTFTLQNVYVEETASVVGPTEGAGPLGDLYDVVIPDEIYGESSWEKAERKMLIESIGLCMNKAGYEPADFDMILAGDLSGQLISANFAARDLPIPFAGIYGACSTFTLTVGMGALLIEGGFMDRVIAGASSHHETAERPSLSYRARSPAESHRYLDHVGSCCGDFGTVGTGAGSEVTFGRVVDYGIKDANNLGAAMAPAAFDTLERHLKNLGKRPEDYDLIATGDLGSVGQIMLKHLMGDSSMGSGNLTDCGLLVYDTRQDTHAGASGCGASACVFSSHFFPLLKKGHIRRLLLLATGALFGLTTAQQKESIPSTSHAICFERVEES